VPLFLAALSSLTFGVADFLGGLATRYAPALTITVGVNAIGLGGVGVALVFVGGAAAPSDLAWGALAGICGSTGLVVYYHALATTRMSVSAPVAAVMGALAPVAFGVIVGERPAPVAWIGVGLALPAVVLIGAGARNSRAANASPGRAVLLGLTSGTLFGFFGIFLSRSAAESGMWPLAGARGAALLLIATVALSRGRPLVATGHPGRLMVTAGILDLVANMMFLVAVRLELLALVSVIMSMYPAATVGLARFVLHERVDRVQAVGMALAVVALALIVAA
jgi:drug/metabolite transporter (DMT)-like permease